jgi:hypothetical protein
MARKFRNRMLNNNNSIQFFIIYVQSQQLQCQLQTQHSVDTGNSLWTKHTIKTNYRRALEEKHINTESKQTNEDEEW